MCVCLCVCMVVCGYSCTCLLSHCVALRAERGGVVSAVGSRSHPYKQCLRMVAKPTIVGTSSSAKRPTFPRTRARSHSLPTPRRGDDTPHDQRWTELALTRENLSWPVQALADAGGRQSRWVGEQTTRSIQKTVRILAQRQGTGARAPTDHLSSKSLAGKNRPHQRDRSSSGAVVASWRGVNTLLERTDSQETNAAQVTPESSGVVDLRWLTQHISSLLMSAETGYQTQYIADNNPGNNGLEAWRRFVQRFGPSSAQASLNVMRNIPKPSNEHNSLLLEEWADIVRR